MTSVKEATQKSDHPIVSFVPGVQPGPKEKSVLNSKYRKPLGMRVYPGVDVLNTDSVFLDHLTALYNDLCEQLPQSDVSFHPVTGHVVSGTSLREWSRLMSTPNLAGPFTAQPYVDNSLQDGFKTQLGRGIEEVSWAWKAYEFVLRRAIDRLDKANLPRVHSYPADSALGPPFSLKGEEKVMFLNSNFIESSINLLFSNDFTSREKKGLLHAYFAGARTNQPDKLGKDGLPKARPIRTGDVKTDLLLYNGSAVSLQAPEMPPIHGHFPVRNRLVYSANNFAQMPLAVLWNIVRYAWKYGSETIKSPTYATIAWHENRWRDKGLYTWSGDGSNWDGKVSIESMMAYEDIMSRIFSERVALSLSEIRMAPILIGASGSGPGRWLCDKRWTYHEFRPGNQSGRMDVSALNDAVNFVNCMAAAKFLHPSITMEDAWSSYRGESDVINLVLYGDDVLFGTKSPPKDYRFPLCDLEMEDGAKLVGSVGFLMDGTIVRMNSAHSFVVNQIFKEGDALKRMYPATGFAAAKQVYSGVPDYDEIIRIWGARVLADFGMSLDDCFGVDKRDLNASKMSDLVAMYIAKNDTRHYMFEIEEIEDELAQLGIFLPHVNERLTSFIYEKYGNL